MARGHSTEARAARSASFTNGVIRMPATKPRRKSAPKKSNKPGPVLARPYRMPATAKQLNIPCAECGKASEWFDPDRVSKALYATDRASHKHRHGFICGQESRSEQAVKLLIKSGQGLISVQRIGPYYEAAFKAGFLDATKMAWAVFAQLARVPFPQHEQHASETE